MLRDINIRFSPRQYSVAARETSPDGNQKLMRAKIRQRIARCPKVWQKLTNSVAAVRPEVVISVLEIGNNPVV